jgi:hypothetical protein
MGKASKYFGPISGILFVAAVVISGGIFSGLDAEPSDSAGQVLAEFRERGDDIQIAALLMMFGLGFLFFFLGHLRTRFRDGGSSWAVDGFLAGGIAVAGAWIVLLGVQLGGAVAAENGHSEVAQGAIDFLWESVYLFTPGLFAVGVAAGAVSFADRILPIWLGVFAVVVALGALAPWMGIFVFIAWVLATSIVELIRAFRPSPVAEDTALEDGVLAR